MPYEMGKIEKGDILEYSWGYDQTNVEFFQVLRTTAKSAWIRKVSRRRAGGDGVMPNREAFVEDEPVQRKQIKVANGREFLTMDFGSAQLWDARPVFETPAGYGH